MSSVFYVLEDEYNRLIEAKKAYSDAIKQQDAGSPQVKHNGNKDYLYLAVRKGDKVIYNYIGEVNSVKANDILASVKKRREYEVLLHGINNDIKEVKKALGGKRKV